MSDKYFNFDFIKEKYYYELDRKDKINDSLNITISILIIIFGVQIYMIQSIIFNNLFNQNIFIILMEIIFALLFIILSYHSFYSSYYVIKCIHKYEYKYLQDLKIYNNYDIQNKISCLIFDINDLKNTDEQLNDKIKNHIIEIDELNTNNNEIKSDYRYKSNKYLAVSLILTFVISIPYFIIFYSTKEDNINKTEIVKILGFGGEQMSNNNIKRPMPTIPGPKIIKESEQKPSGKNKPTQ